MSKRALPTQTWQELRVIREKDGYSLTSLAKAADMSLGYLSDLENGRREPSRYSAQTMQMVTRNACGGPCCWIDWP